jgi:DNA/RNA endonuclease YhcR with UshA esterase domain
VWHGGIHEFRDPQQRKFGTPETTLLGKRVYATGAIKEYRGKPEIVATDPRQLTTQ